MTETCKKKKTKKIKLKNIGFDKTTEQQENIGEKTKKMKIEADLVEEKFPLYEFGNNG